MRVGPSLVENGTEAPKTRCQPFGSVVPVGAAVSQSVADGPCSCDAFCGSGCPAGLFGISTRRPNRSVSGAANPVAPEPAAGEGAESACRAPGGDVGVDVSRPTYMKMPTITIR